MSQYGGGPVQLGLPKPGKALGGVMLALFLLWLMFAVAINWGGASPRLFELFCANAPLILQGEIWRLFTAPLMHSNQGISHILFSLLGFYFLTPSLEQAWGGKRLLRFLVASALIAYGFQLLMLLLLPADIAGKLAGPLWFGAFPVVEAIAIAWALSFKGQTVRLFFVLPISSRGLVIMVVAFSVLRVIGATIPPEGLLSPFGGMAAGWLLGGKGPSPLRRAYLKFKLRQLDREAQRTRTARKARIQQSPFDVLDGGKSDKRKKDKDSDGNWLN